MTSTTSATASPSSNCTSRTAARIIVVRSVTICTSSAAGSDSCSFGRIALTLSTV
nr:hypothetical protein [Burkholderia pseudomallei]